MDEILNICIVNLPIKKVYNIKNITLDAIYIEKYEYTYIYQIDDIRIINILVPDSDDLIQIIQYNNKTIAYVLQNLIHNIYYTNETWTPDFINNKSDLLLLLIRTWTIIIDYGDINIGYYLKLTSVKSARKIECGLLSIN